MRLMPHAAVGLVLSGLVLAGCTRQPPSLDPAVARFAEAKRAQAQTLVVQQNLRMPAEGWRLFDAVQADDFARATNLFARLERGRSAGTSAQARSFQRALDWPPAFLQRIGLAETRIPGWQSAAWHPLAEAYWAYVLSKTWHKPYLDMAVQGIVEAVPTNAIFFGGTDVGRFAVSAALESQIKGRPFFALTQMQLADGGSYLEYLHSMFGTNIVLPTAQDYQQTYSAYLADAQGRAVVGSLKEGESVTGIDGSASVSGQAAVAEINALLVQFIFEQNTNREVFIEQCPAWPVEWTYPHLIPHGPVFKICREPQAQIDEAILQADRAFWSHWCGRLIGDWIRHQTSVTDVCEFVERVYVRNDLGGFEGDPQYLHDTHARDYFGWLRHSSAALYQWRCVEANDVPEKQRMLFESLLAYKQAFALNPSVAMDFADLLMQINSHNDARRVLELGVRLHPTNMEVKARLEDLKAKMEATK